VVVAGALEAKHRVGVQPRTSGNDCGPGIESCQRPGLRGINRHYGTFLERGRGMGELAHEILSAATTLSGLLLIFLGGLVSRYESMPPDRRSELGPTYRRRGFLAFAGFLAACSAAVLAILSLYTGSNLLADIATVLLSIAFVILVFAAVLVAIQLLDRT
jgi:hypothetical protein